MGVRYECKKAGILFVFAVLLSFSLHSGAAERGERAAGFGGKPGVRKLAQNGGLRYVEVEITLSEEFDLDYISGLPRAAGNEPEVSEDSRRVKVQLPVSVVTGLAEAGAEVEPVRKFVLIEGSGGGADGPDGDIGPLATCSGTYEERSNDDNILIEDHYYWYGSPIDFSGSSVTFPVNCIDIHYVVRLNSYNFFDVSFSEEDYLTYIYPLVVSRWGGDGDIIETTTGVTGYNGEPVNQEWILWAAESATSGSSYIDSWWIKLYYEEDYCYAEGDYCAEGDYISRVQVGDIDNSSGCDNYGDYTSLSTSMEIGESYPIQVDNYNAYDEQDQCGIWVDWNQDLDFYDAGETISVSGTPGVGPYTATITPPAWASLGSTRMRVRIRWTGALDPCFLTEFGDVEDYTITVVDTPSYCDASGGGSEYISGVEVKDINNTGTGSDNYADYTFLSTEMDKGSSYPIKVTNGYDFATDYCGIWVDWNQDLDFDDADEAIYVYDVPSRSPYMAIITPPQDALLGDTRMRVRIWQDNPAGPCGDKARGEVEDYTITVTDDGGCGATQYGGGCGSQAEPYLINTPEHMQAIGQSPWDWDKYFELMDDIDLSGYTGDSFNTIGYYIPFSIQLPFTGVFDGNQHTISNFTYYSTNKIEMGLFAFVRDVNAEIKNLTLADPNFYVVTGNDFGLLVGWLDEGTVSNCHIDGGSISGAAEVGGLVGKLGDLGGNSASLINCSSSASVSRGAFIGGLVGKSDQTGTISNCYSAGSVSGDMTIGGLVGFNRGPITNCYSKSSVSGLSDDIGGLVGLNQFATISKSYSTGEVIGAGDVGGFVGWNLSGTIADSFWDIEKSNQNNGVGSGSSAGVMGKSTEQMQTQSTFTDAGWDFTTPVWQMCECADYPRLWWETVKYGGGRGTSGEPYLICTAEQMQAIGEDPNYWDGHFKLMADIDLSAYTGTEFNIIGNYLEPFTGAFDGNGKKITNFTYSASSEHNIGILGYAEGPDVEIKALLLVDVQIDAGSSDFVGSLIGRNLGGTVTNCSSSGNITGHNNVGGLVGYSSGILTSCHSTANVWGTLKIGGLVGANGGTISNCFSVDDVTGGIYAGGLVGENDGTISKCYTMSSVFGTGENTGGFVGINDWGGKVSNCYSMSSVSGSFSSHDNVGGFAGENGMAGEILNCYSAGHVNANTSSTGGLVGLNYNTVTASFWDKQTSGQLYSAGGSGKSTEQMQTESMFTSAGWDFVGEFINGPNDVWKICEGTNYPKLAWQIPFEGDFVCPDGVDSNDLEILCEQWLLEELSWDVGPGGGDGFVDFLDWSFFADGWYETTDMYDLGNFVGQWLRASAYCADIAPEPDGDDLVNMLDFAVFAENWLEGF